MRGIAWVVELPCFSVFRFVFSRVCRDALWRTTRLRSPFVWCWNAVINSLCCNRYQLDRVVAFCKKSLLKVWSFSFCFEIRYLSNIVKRMSKQLWILMVLILSSSLRKRFVFLCHVIVLVHRSTWNSLHFENNAASFWKLKCRQYDVKTTLDDLKFLAQLTSKACVYLNALFKWLYFETHSISCAKLVVAPPSCTSQRQKVPNKRSIRCRTQRSTAQKFVLCRSIGFHNRLKVCTVLSFRVRGCVCE